MALIDSSKIFLSNKSGEELIGYTMPKPYWPVRGHPIAATSDNCLTILYSYGDYASQGVPKFAKFNTKMQMLWTKEISNSAFSGYYGGDYGYIYETADSGYAIYFYDELQQSSILIKTDKYGNTSP
jgi:hypothetical protein